MVHASALIAQAEKELKRKPGVAERTARAIRLKEELNLILELVVKMRERLERELEDSDQVQAKYIDKGFISKLRELSMCYERLTSSRIALGKAEKAEEAEMTPAEEMEAVRAFIMALDNTERAKFLWKLNEAHKNSTEKDRRINNGRTKSE